jgi:hypothetical protein
LTWGDVEGWEAAAGANLGTRRSIPGEGDLYAVARSIETHELDGIVIIGGFQAYRALNRINAERKRFPALSSMFEAEGHGGFSVRGAVLGHVQQGGVRRLLRGLGDRGRNAETPIERKPPWIKTTLRHRWAPSTKPTCSAGEAEGLHTVCQEAGCPNIYECWEDREATFLIGGDSAPALRLLPDRVRQARPLRPRRAARVAESVQKMGLRYATVTGVCRDDLPDEGAWLYAETIRQIHDGQPGHRRRDARPDFSGKARAARARCSTPAPRCSRTTSRRCRGSSSASAPPSATTARSTCSPRPARRGWSPSRT